VKDGKFCIVRSSIICTVLFTKHSLSEVIKVDEVGVLCSEHSGSLKVFF
jgi:hypothetical protein